MKAVVVERYGPPDVLRLVEVAKPIPRDNELLVRVRATTVNSGDARVRALRVPRGVKLLSRLRLGLVRPRHPILGFELAGEIEAVGASVTAYRPGERVVGSAGFAFGCHAEYRCLPDEAAIAPIPESLGFEEAVSLCFGGATAAYFLRRGELARGETLLVNGASGAVGTMAVQLAKRLGAEVTGVCSSANLDLVRSLGADHVIDYTKDDFSRNGLTYDVVMDTVGNAPFSRARTSLRSSGRFLMVVGNLPQMLLAGFQRQVVSAAAKDSEMMTSEAYRFLLDLAAAGELRPVIDRTYPLERISEAHAYVDTGRKRGSVVITVGSPL
jgi:NADPH:quinone reductase-like Zn-dependent oxidoreductase